MVCSVGARRTRHERIDSHEAAEEIHMDIQPFRASAKGTRPESACSWLETGTIFCAQRGPQTSPTTSTTSVDRTAATTARVSRTHAHAHTAQHRRRRLQACGQYSPLPSPEEFQSQSSVQIYGGKGPEIDISHNKPKACSRPRLREPCAASSTAGTVCAGEGRVMAACSSITGQGDPRGREREGERRGARKRETASGGLCLPNHGITAS